MNYLKNRKLIAPKKQAHWKLKTIGYSDNYKLNQVREIGTFHLGQSLLFLFQIELVYLRCYYCTLEPNDWRQINKLLINLYAVLYDVAIRGVHRVGYKRSTRPDKISNKPEHDPNAELPKYAEFDSELPNLKPTRHEVSN